jgi:hypothetical protein
MKHPHPTSLISPIAVACACCLWAGCATVRRAEYDAVALRPRDPQAVRVKVSLQNRMVYVLEGQRPLLVTPTSIGKPGTPTPTGRFSVINKIERKRSNSYGFWIRGDQTAAGQSSRSPLGGGRYVGYPMAYWVEFTPAYGFHEGSVWPTPRTHGCLRLHRNVAPKFFALTRIGTPVHIASSQPEDATIGRAVRRPQDYADPDPPAALLVSPEAFRRPAGPLLVDAR